MIFVNEWLPNPVGPDAAGEWVEIFNNGGAAVDLRGWILETESGKKFTFNDALVPARGYLLLPRAATKLSLKNSDGGLALYNAAGALVDAGHFDGTAPEGESFSRVDYGAGPAQHFAFTAPSPGAANKAVSDMVAVHSYPAGTTLTRGLTIAEFSAIMIGAAILLAGLIIYVIKTNEDLSELLFGDN